MVNMNIVNFIKNIKPVMMKLHEDKKITKEEGKTIVQFYLEVIDLVEKVSIDLEEKNA